MSPFRLLMITDDDSAGCVAGAVAGMELGPAEGGDNEDPGGILDPDATLSWVKARPSRCARFGVLVVFAPPDRKANFLAGWPPVTWALRAVSSSLILYMPVISRSPRA